MARMDYESYAVDRIEGGVALCECIETGVCLPVDVARLPTGIREGDIIRLEGGEYLLDREQTEARRKRLTARLNARRGTE